MLQMLLEHGADPNVGAPTFLPLKIAVSCGHLNAVKLLRKSGAQLSFGDVSESAIVVAAERNYLEILEYLLERETSALSSCSLGMVGERKTEIRAAFEAGAKCGAVRICRYLLDCTETVLDTSTAMFIACAHGQSEVVQFFLSR